MANDNKKLSDLTDEELIHRFQHDDLAAYDIIILRYKDQLLNFAYRFLGNIEESEDIVQETFLRLWRNRHAYRQIAKFSTWIYTIAGNLAKTELRKRKRRRITQSMNYRPAFERLLFCEIFRNFLMKTLVQFYKFLSGRLNQESTGPV